MPDLTELQRLAEGATPGPWKAGPRSFQATKVTAPEAGEHLPLDVRLYGVSPDDNKRNAAYIAAMHPDTAKKLIAVALAAQKAVDALEEAQTYTASRSWSPSMTRECKDAEVGLRTALEELK